MAIEVDGALQIDPRALANEIIEAAEFYRDSAKTTVWIDVTNGHPPAALLLALLKLAGFGAGVVITHEATLTCSHPPGARLPLPLREAVAKVNRGGLVWHPYAQQLVHAEP